MKIIRVLRVEDTRQWEEGPDDRWYPIPGSGQENQCGRCGRSHEIHATVELEDKTTMIVGTGCMKADEAVFGSQIKSVLSAQKTLAKHEHFLAKYSDLMAENRAIMARIDTLPVPMIEAVKWNLAFGEKREVLGFQIGDARVRSDGYMGPTYTEKETLIGNWKYNRAKEFGLTAAMQNAPYNVGAEQKQIAKIKAKIEKLMAGEKL